MKLFKIVIVSMFILLFPLQGQAESVYGFYEGIWIATVPKGTSPIIDFPIGFFMLRQNQNALVVVFLPYIGDIAANRGTPGTWSALVGELSTSWTVYLNQGVPSDAQGKATLKFEGLERASFTLTKCATTTCKNAFPGLTEGDVVSLRKFF